MHWIFDGRFPRVEDIRENDLVGAIDGLIREHRPDVIVGHWVEDPNTCHARLARATVAALRRTHASLYATPPSEFRSPLYDKFPANVFMNISNTLQIKNEALAKYSYESWNFQPVDSDALEKIARANGARLGWVAAERLLLVRQIGLHTNEMSGAGCTTAPLPKQG